VSAIADCRFEINRKGEGQMLRTGSKVWQSAICNLQSAIYLLLGIVGILAVSGCIHTPVDTTERSQGPAPLHTFTGKG
jgi:hypothetical protein